MSEGCVRIWHDILPFGFQIFVASSNLTTNVLSVKLDLITMLLVTETVFCFIADINLRNVWNAFPSIKHSVCKFVGIGLISPNKNEIGIVQ